MLRALECRSPCGGDMEGETRAVGREVSVQHSHRGRSRTWALKWALFLLFPPLPFLFLTSRRGWMAVKAMNTPYTCRASYTFTQRLLAALYFHSFLTTA